ncbi:tetratricopeptide repeat protein 1 [Mustela nigripes]|uniref:Tetratricopeptide repeat protein 1 n=2 Tax=Mustela putorius furo TaxID=9669 RepID=M3YPG7_MUSPF|nr:tetratricopeptide repeat protein 1 [Mustela putorius furo]XP_004737761.1 tetratricopeptide repeat protein 1 [Mustela putorius furo]XP_004737764.1 tetratricopeptide repeat protein 1 [Mustela putorius furo]XP_059030183.1 tetratricopeptide repeat protein 1 [Mustela lutreola]XP_059030184.1 tetratricopeptide repeat protein 1 [Mustela lutreola]XP_059030185.1 tetratricopeptide repeat protein 1 [Mustela lutreola]XP_059273270.1 tetratricopeptide repeat protein 1 [Mustela nigripes]XP_059273271.1 te
MGEKSENCGAPEDLFNGLKITDPQEAECATPPVSSPRDHHLQSKLFKDVESHSQEDQGEEECFHDLSASFEKEEPGADKVENKPDDNVNSSELDEEYLIELEKNMPDEEKQKRREESTRLKEEGNAQFKRGDYTEAESSYSQALQMCPSCFQKDRSILFSNRAAARMKQDKKEMAISDCNKAIQLNPGYIRAILRRAELYEKTDKLDEALEDYKSILEKDPSIHQAREACMRLPKQIEERNERLKAEMLGKLKDLGNLVLRPFGLSTENFQIKQDSSTGSYSINFVQNPNNNR